MLTFNFAKRLILLSKLSNKSLFINNLRVLVLEYFVSKFEGSSTQAILFLLHAFISTFFLRLSNGLIRFNCP